MASPPAGVVLLTGVTGLLGRHLLSYLLANTAVKKIICPAVRRLQPAYERRPAVVATVASQWPPRRILRRRPFVGPALIEEFDTAGRRAGRDLKLVKSERDNTSTLCGLL